LTLRNEDEQKSEYWIMNGTHLSFKEVNPSQESSWQKGRQARFQFSDHVMRHPLISFPRSVVFIKDRYGLTVNPMKNGYASSGKISG
jgi:hypothetical protein